MKTKLLGATNIKIPAIGQGAGDLFWNSSNSRTDKVNVLRLGLELGMNLIDTGEAYGEGESEKIVGEAITDARDEVILATKVSEYHLTREEILRSAEGSLRRLGTEYIDLYQIHWTNPQIPVAETMEAMSSLLESGKVRNVGLCNVTESQFKEFQAALGTQKIVALQNEFNLFERTIEYSGLISFCRNNGISTIAYSPLDQGRIENMSLAQSNVLSNIAKSHNKTIAQVILCWLISHPGVITLVRSTKPTHVRENAVASDFELSRCEAQEINTVFYDEILNVPTEKIRISLNGEWNHAVYQTLDEALANNHGFAPSPEELSRSMGNGELLKPVRLVPSLHNDYEYDLIAGRIRYWAWVIAHQGTRPIPAYIRKDMNG